MIKRDNRYLWFAGLFLLSLAIRLALLDYSILRVIEPDGAGYVADAKGFLEGFDIRRINLIDHPLFPVLIALFSYIAPDWEMAGRMASMAAGSLMSSLVFLISSARGNSLRVSLFAGVFIAIAPMYIKSSCWVFNDSLNCVFLLFGVLQLFVAMKTSKIKNFFLSGTGFSFAYLTRPDSIVPSFFAFLFVAYHLIIRDVGGKRLVGFAAFAGGFALMAIPYILFLHAQLGQWVVTGRQVAALINISSYSTGRYEIDNYGLTKDILLRSDPLHRASTGGTDVKKGLFNRWMKDPGAALSLFVTNLKMEGYAYIDVIPWYITLLAVISVINFRSGFFNNNLPLFVYSAPLFFLYPLFWSEGRHIYYFLIPVWLWATEGVEVLSAKLQKILSHSKSCSSLISPQLFNRFIYMGVVVALALSFKPKVIGEEWPAYLMQKEAGVWISKNTPPNAVIMARWGRIAIYTDRKCVPFPLGEWNDIKEYIQKNGVTHMVMGDEFLTIRPQIKHLLIPLFSGSEISPDPSLSIAYKKDDGLSGIIVYEVKRN